MAAQVMHLMIMQCRLSNLERLPKSIHITIEHRSRRESSNDILWRGAMMMMMVMMMMVMTIYDDNNKLGRAALLYASGEAADGHISQLATQSMAAEGVIRDMRRRSD